jgi:hypothetical protein
MQDADLRTTLLQALSESPYFEHKLVLPEFFDTPTGKRVLAAAASASGRPVEAVAGLVAGAPRMDLYVPYRSDRLQWSADQPINVAALVDEIQPVYAFTGSGDSTFYDRGSFTPVSETATLLLGPHEAVMTRPSASLCAGPRT